MEHPVLTNIQQAGFTPLGWFEPDAADAVPHEARFVILVGNAGSEMFRRFAYERDHRSAKIDDWTRDVIGGLAEDLSAEAVFPFDMPPLPFLTWARRAGAGHVSPLGLNIHPTYGLWHAFRAALLFPVAFDLPVQPAGAHPCESCVGKPCLSACPVHAFDGSAYNVAGCAAHLEMPAGEDCMSGGCLARRACPVGREFTYHPMQANFFMRAFRTARRNPAGNAA
jgi:epoxyqueuosine reductase QueG